MCTSRLSGSKVMRRIGTFGPIKTICNSRLPQALMANETMSNVKEPGCKRNMYPENKCTSRSVLSHVASGFQAGLHVLHSHDRSVV